MNTENRIKNYGDAARQGLAALLPFALLSLFSLSTLFFPLTTSASLSLGTAGITQPISTVGLVGYWPMEEGSGTLTVDRSGYGNTGTLSGATLPTWGTGKFGNALSFNGTTGYVNIPDNAAMDTTSTFTVSAWINSSSIGTEQMVFSNTNTTIGWHVEIYTSKMLMQVYPGGAYAFSNVTLQSNKWYHLLVTYNAGNVSYYVNGVAAGTGSYTFTAPTGVAKRIGLFGNGSLPFIGKIDDARFYNRVLSAAEVKALYYNESTALGHANTTALSSGLVGYWPLDGSTINWKTGTISDLSGQGNNGTPVGLSTTTSVVTGRIGQALNFNGSSSYLHRSSLGSSLGASVTVCAWVKTSYAGGNQYIWSIDRNPSSITNEAIFQIVGGKLRYWDYTGAAYGFADNTPDSNTTVTDGAWHDVCFTKSGTAGTFYIDGHSDGTKTASTNVSYGTTDPIVGTNYRDGNLYFNGTMDDVRVYNRALSAAEVALLYASGNVNAGHSNASPQVGLNAGLVGYWTFDGGNMNWKTGTAADSSGQGNNGSLVSMSTTTSVTIGKIGQALKFNGSTSDVLRTGMSPSTASEVTVAFWAKVNSNDGGYNGFVSSQNTGNDYAEGFNIDLCNPSTASFSCLNAEGAGISAPGGWDAKTASTPFGQWVHVAVVYGSGTNGLKVYFNGVLDGQHDRTAGSIDITNIRIGARYYSGTSSGKYLDGQMDDVRIYNRALSAAEVQQLYKMGK